MRRPLSTTRSLPLPSVLFLALSTALSPLVVSAAEATNPVAAARDAYKEYIEIRKVIGEESASWSTQQQTLGDMLGVLKAGGA